MLVTGDLVHIGLEQEMSEAAQWLRSLGPPEKVILVPGNHDNYAADSLGSPCTGSGATTCPIGRGRRRLHSGYPL